MTITNLFNTSKYVRKDEIQGEIPGFFKVCKDVMKIVWASMIESLLVSLVTMFDGIQVASIGNEANAAVAITKQPYFILVAIIVSLNIAITAIVSRRKGEKDIINANKTTHMGIVLSFCLSIIFSIIMVIFARPLCLMMQAEEDTIELAVTYFQIICGGFIFNGLAMTINACQRGVGNTRISLLTNIIANLVNIFLNYCLIGGNLGFPRLEIKGAAIATIIGQFTGFMFALVYAMRQKDYVQFRFNRLFNWDKETLKPLIQLFPSTLIEQIIMRIGFIVFAIIVNGLGTTDTYIHGVCNDINSMLFALADGFAVGTSAVIGHRLGEKRKDLAIVYAKVALTLSVSSGIILCLLMLLFRESIISLYKPDNEYKFNAIRNLLLIAGACVVFQNLQWVTSGVLRTAGDSKYTARVSLLSIVIIRPIIAYLLIYVLFNHYDVNGSLITGMGVYGAWVAHLIDQGIRMTLHLNRFNSRKWVHIKV